MIRDAKWHGIACALGAAGLFGASTPLAKLVLPKVEPALMAGLLYLGSGLGLGAYWLARGGNPTSRRTEARLKGADAGWLAGAILAGGVAGPVFLMWGLVRSPASSASLLLNLEAVLTCFLAWLVFKENVNRRVAIGMGLIVVGGLCLSWTGQPGGGVGLLAIGAACLAWAIDNNLTRKVSAADPVQVSMVKGLVAGGVNTGLALAGGAKLPEAAVVAQAGLIGFLGYGVSLVLFVLSLRHLGAARTGAYFSTAPFVGAVIAMLALGDRVGMPFAAAAVLMGTGVWLHLTERHAHPHRHEPVVHEHPHTHDEHHQHAHRPEDPAGEPHLHAHLHKALVHSHPHYPDTHHRHEH